MAHNSRYSCYANNNEIMALGSSLYQIFLINRERTKNIKDMCFRLYIWKFALQPIKDELYYSRDPTEDIKMHSHYNFLLIK